MSQGELVDRIDVNVKQTQDYVAEARQETKKAVVYKKKSRKVSLSLPPLPYRFADFLS